MSIVVELELESGEFTTRMIHAGQSVRQFTSTLDDNVVMIRRAQSQSAGFLATMRDFAIVFGVAGTAINSARQVVGGWVGDIVRVNAEMERMAVLMRGMSSATDPLRDAAENVAYLREMARNAPFSLSAMSEAFTRLKATGIDPTTGSLQAYVDGIAGMGGTEDTLKRASVAIAQMAGKGVIQMEELRQQLGEAIPRATELMARSLGVSYATLVQQISTGTVAARENLAAMEMELERVFGGSAQAQMETYNGLVARIKTQFQDLALIAGEAGFFDAVKNQLQEFSDALNGRLARGLARELGETFASITNGAAEVVRFVVQFRNEIYQTGQVLVAAFATRATIAGLAALAGSIGMARKELTLLNAQFAMTQRMSAAGGAVAGATTAMSALGTAAATTGAIISGVATGIAVMAPYLPLLAGAVMIAGSAFGWFSDSARNAWEELEKFGATSGEQIEQARNYLAEQERIYAQLERQREQRSRTIMGWNKADKEQNRATFREQFNQENDMEGRRAKLAQMRMQLAGWVSDHEEDEAKRAADAKLRELGREEQSLRAIYDRNSREREKQYQADVNAASRAGKSTSEIDKRYANDRRQLIQTTYDQRIELYRKDLDTQIEISKNGDEAQRRAAEATIVRLSEALERLEAFKKQAASMPDGTTLVEKPLDDDALWKRGNQHLERIRAEIASTKAELSGAQGEAAKLAYQLSQSRYGDQDTRRVRELADSLIKAQEEKERLDDLLEGRNKLDREIMSARVRAEQELIDIQTKGFSGAEVILKKYAMGYYKGLGPGSEARTAVDGLSASLVMSSTNATKASNAVSQGIFSSELLTRGRTMVDIIKQMGSNWSVFAQSVATTDLQKAFKLPSPSGQNRSSIMFGGATDTAKLAGSTDALRTRLEALIAAMPDGMRVAVTSGFRTVEEQTKLWAAAVQKYGSEQEARKWVAPPGNSAHNRGEAADLQFNSDGARQWAHDNAQFFGLKFPMQNEPWHIQLDTNAPEKIDETVRKIQELKEAEARLRSAKFAEELTDDTKKLNAELTESEARIDGIGKKEAEIRAKIKAGDYGADTNPLSTRYAEVLKAAQAADQAEEQRAQNQKRRDAEERARSRIGSNLTDLDERSAEARARLNDPTMFEQGDGYFRLLRQYQQYLSTVLAGHGADSDEFRRAMAEKEAALQRFYNADIMSRAASLQDETRQIRLSMMTTSQARDYELQYEIRIRQRMLEMFRGNAEERLQIERVVTENIIALREQAALSTPMGQMFQQWGDAAENFGQVMSNAWETSIDGLTQFLTTGQGDVSSMLQSISQDVMSFALKLGAARMFGDKATAATSSKATKLFGVAHTGASNVAQPKARRSASPLSWLGAQRFHNGGYPGLRPNEVPIIAKKGEEVGWPDQLAKKYGGRRMGDITIRNEMQINASGGSPQQNDDLARRIGAQVEEVTRSVVQDEIIRQMRPGNLLG